MGRNANGRPIGVLSTANGRPIGVLTGATERAVPVAQPLPPQVPLQRTARPVPIQQVWRLNP